MGAPGANYRWSTEANASKLRVSQGGGMATPDFFGNEQSIRALHEELAEADGMSSARCYVLIDLTWHLRQRDTVTALRYADEGDARLEATIAPRSVVNRARLIVARAGAQWVMMRLDQARRLAEQAECQFIELDDWAGAGDAQMVPAAARPADWCSVDLR